MYYKVIFDGSVIDALDGLQYVVQNKSNHGVIGTDDELEAMGVLSSDCEEIWHVDTMRDFYQGDYKTVRIVEIEEDVYNELREELVKNGMLEDESEPEIPEPSTPVMEPVAKSEMAKEMDALREQVELLTGCVLEMSELVYV